MLQPLEPNRIHTLPVQIRYQLPCSSQSFTTLLPALQQVYVYPAAPLDTGANDESWGSIYLKTVVQGVVMASPEYHPSYQVKDASLYIFDPRETRLRQSRASTSTSPQHEVWTGKGLISWALNELGVGKNLITGRLVRGPEYSVPKGGNPLQELAGQQESWGIEVSLGLKDGSSGSVGFQSRRPVPAVTPAITAPPVKVASATTTTATTTVKKAPTRRAPASAPAPAPATAAPKATGSRKRPTPPRHLVNVDTNSRRVSGPSLPLDIPRHVFDNPELLTKEQAERLIASPFFLKKISEMTGHPIVPKKDDGKKRAREEEAKQMCYNCGRVKSYVWRSTTLEDDTVVTICNACGLYKNRHGHMRPPSMWEGVEDDVKAVIRPTPSSDIVAPRVDSGFKRTMSTAVNNDAKRIASRMKSISRPLMTSPARNTRSATRMDMAASSPALKPKFELDEATLRKILGTSVPMEQPANMPLSDDGGDGQIDWSSADISSFFNVDGFDVGPHGATAQKSPAAAATFHRTSSTASKRRHISSGAADEDDVLSQLFNRTSSIGPIGGSSPSHSMPFDFSQLPPSSPPASTGPSSDLGHSVLLLSSPGDVSPLSMSPLDRNGFPMRVSPDKKSGLKNSYTYTPAADENKAPPPPPPEYSYEDIWAKLQLGDVSSGSAAEGLLGVGGASSSGTAAGAYTDDFMAYLDSLTH